MDTPGLTGAVGLIKSSYHTAATVTQYQITRDELSGAFVLTGTVTSSDPYLLQHEALAFVIPRMKARWAIETITVTTSGQVRAQLHIHPINGEAI
jgi:hypothetical protein